MKFTAPLEPNQEIVYVVPPALILEILIIIHRGSVQVKLHNT